MTSAPEEFDELRGRVDRLEAEMPEVRGIAENAQARAERAEVLARLADKDTSDIKTSHGAIMRSMEALRETQIEQGRDISVLRSDVSVLKSDVSVLRGDAGELRRGLRVVRDGVATIITLLSNGHSG